MLNWIKSKLFFRRSFYKKPINNGLMFDYKTHQTYSLIDKLVLKTLDFYFIVFICIIATFCFLIALLFKNYTINWLLGFCVDGFWIINAMFLYNLTNLLGSIFHINFNLTIFECSDIVRWTCIIIQKIWHHWIEGKNINDNVNNWRPYDWKYIKNFLFSPTCSINLVYVFQTSELKYAVMKEIYYFFFLVFTVFYSLLIYEIIRFLSPFLTSTNYWNGRLPLKSRTVPIFEGYCSILNGLYQYLKNIFLILIFLIFSIIILFLYVSNMYYMNLWNPMNLSDALYNPEQIELFTFRNSWHIIAEGPNTLHMPVMTDLDIPTFNQWFKEFIYRYNKMPQIFLSNSKINDQDYLEARAFLITVYFKAFLPLNWKTAFFYKIWMGNFFFIIIIKKNFNYFFNKIMAIKMQIKM